MPDDVTSIIRICWQWLKECLHTLFDLVYWLVGYHVMKNLFEPFENRFSLKENLWGISKWTNKNLDYVVFNQSIV